MKNIIYSTIFLIFCCFGAVKTHAQCQIFDLVATEGDCVNGEYFVTINFQYDGVGNEGFHLQGGGNNYGNFAYSALPVTVGPFPGNGSSVFEFVAIDNQHPDCSDFDIAGPVSCAGGACDIFDFVATPGDCNSDGTYQLHLDFQVENAGNNFFEVFYEGQNIGLFALAALPITIQHFDDNGEPNQAIQVCINDVPDCCAIDEFTAPDCVAGACDIFDFVAETGDCNSDGTYQLTLDFNYENPGNTLFNVIYEGQNIGTFPLADLPITIQHFDDNGEPSQVINVCINDVPDCCAHDTFSSPDCTPNGDCHIFEVFAEAHPCNAEGQFMLDVEFASQNTGSQGFKIRANDQWFGPFAYGDPFYTIGPLNPGVVYEIVVRDVEF
ncbi:MAG: hypothetical protein IPM82_24130 [Saprospiraceae bacterium]|nr:hypothetical protein [Saprospiraceae bacterium]